MTDLSLVILGFCLGIIIMGIIADRVNKAQVKELEERISVDSRNYLTAVSTMESQVDRLTRELTVQKNIVKTLSENNQRLLKSNQQLKKANQELRER